MRQQMIMETFHELTLTETKFHPLDDESGHEDPPPEDCWDFSVAVAGGPGVGKTVLIQSLLGFSENGQDSRAAFLHPNKPGGPLLYLHPSHPGLTFWELPLDDGPPEKWISEADLLLLVTDTQFTQAHVDLAHSALIQAKKLCLVRTKVDCDLHTLKRRMREDYSRVEVLSALRSVIQQPFNDSARKEALPLFLISGYEPSKLDAPALKAKVEETSRELGRALCLAQQGYEVIGYEEIAELQSALERGGISEMVRFIQSSLDSLLDTRFDLALMGGNPGFRHSVLNALRGLKDGEDGSAHGGNPENPIEYASLKYPKASLWDLPGMESLESQPKKYLESVHVSRYDVTLLFLTPWQEASSSYQSLVHELKKEGKKSVFIQDCDDHEVPPGPREDQVFVLSPVKLPGPEFHRFLGYLEKKLPSHKLRAFMLSLPNLSAEVIEKKKEALSQEVWKVALLSSLVASVPVPGVGIACDLTLLTARLDTYRQELGLDADSLANLSHKSGVPVPKLMLEIQSPAGKGVTRELVQKMLGSATGIGLEVAGVFLHRFPLLGPLATGGIAFHASYLVLSRCLEAMAEDAQRVLSRAQAHV
ncbi:interferon-inducible GTPase 5-like isoform X2 [Engystomops pustulosus]|uniref:interferon-inducible GTPase 5-like isoform X2 n=2 Tax=Engystomops pustulosus TaxID=76066 RepID=UPI003AFA7DD9